MSLSRQSILLGLALSLTAGPLAAQTARRDPATIARVLLGAMDAGDSGRVDALLDSSFVLHYQGVPDPISKKDFLGLLGVNLAAFPDMRHEVHEVWPSGNTVTLNVMTRGTHKGTYEGVPASGKQIAVGALHVIRVKNGKIVEWWAAEDDLGTYRQIGMVIKPPPATP